MSVDNETLPLWYDIDGEIVCMFCKEKLLQEWSPEAVRARYAENDLGEPDNEDEMVRPEMFRALGRRPWAGNDVGERYMQCDHCQGQFGPDA